jgi:hypothetical protein
LSLLFSRLEGQESNQQLIAAIREHGASLHRVLQDVHTCLGSTLYPFDHAKGSITLAEYLLPGVPPEDELGALYEAAEQFLDRLPSLYARVAGRLAIFAEQVEQLLGLPPLEPAAGDSGAQD